MINRRSSPESYDRPPKTVFVDNFFYQRSNRGASVIVVPHLGLMTLASILERASHAVEIFDPKILFAEGGWRLPDANFLDAWAEHLVQVNADVIGFTAYGRSLPYAIRVATRIKKQRPHQPVVLGGPHATIIGPQILEEFPCFDVVVRYEAEPIIQPLIERLRGSTDLDGIPNLVYRRAGRLCETKTIRDVPEMDDLPSPALHLYPMERLQQSELSIEAGRGCPYRCTFCSTASFFQRRYRLKSNRRMIEEMEQARTDYGINVINLNHDLFGLNKKMLREFCEQVHDRGFHWKCSMRTDTLDEELAEPLAAAGCRHLYFGIETGSPRLQVSIQKKLDLQLTKRIVRRVASAGISCTTSFITGFPDEEEADQDLTLDLIGELLELDPWRVRPQLHLLSPEPGSPLSESSDRTAFDGIGPEADEIVDDEMVRAHPRVFSVFFHFESLVSRWRSLYASAFVTYLMPEWGYPLTVHLCRNFFEGRLSRMFRELLPEAPATLDYDNLLAALRASAEQLAARRISECPHLGELMRFANILSEFERARTIVSPGNVGEENEKTLWLVRFDFDILMAVRAVLAEPSADWRRLRPAAVETWYLVYADHEGQTMIVRVEDQKGRQLSELSDDQGAVSERHRKLGVCIIHS